MSKDFKTVDELVMLLESRGVKTDSDTAPALSRDGYYAIVNGYKDPFLDRSAMMSSSDDVYANGTTFKQIYGLFLFDREMRSCLMPSLIEAESAMKNAISYAFCEKYGYPDAYLDRSSYCRAADMLTTAGFRGNKTKEHSKNLNRLMRVMNGKLSVTDRTRPFIKHYLDSYGSVPLWVLQNDLTFGNMAHFYQLQERGIQNRACRIIQTESAFHKRIGARDLLAMFEVLVGFRNICAHDDRLYCASVKSAHFDSALNALSSVLAKGQYVDLVKRLESTEAKFCNRVDPRIFNGMHSRKIHAI